MTDPVRDAIAAAIAELPKLATTPSTTRYGIDLVCVDDVDTRLSETSDDKLESLAQDLYHRVTTPRGALIDDPDYGDDVTAYLSGDAQPGDLISIEGRLASECRKDDRVDRIVVTVTAPEPNTLHVELFVTPNDPDITSFTLILAVTNAAALLEAILKGS